MNKEEEKKMLARVQAARKRLMDILIEEADKVDADHALLFVYMTVSNFSAWNLYKLQKATDGEYGLFEYYMETVKNLLAIMTNGKSSTELEKNAKEINRKIKELEKEQEDLARKAFEDYDGKLN